jgi:hypothetical protein
MRDEMEGMWTETAVSCFRELFRCLSGDFKENHVNVNVYGLCPKRDSNQTTWVLKSEALPPEPLTGSIIWHSLKKPYTWRGQNR